MLPAAGVSCTIRVVQQMTETVSPSSYPAPSGLLFDRMLRSDRVVPLARPLPVEVAVEEGHYVLTNDEFGLFVVAPSMDEAIRGCHDQLALLFRAYVDVNSDELAGDAKELRSRLLSLL